MPEQIPASLKGIRNDPELDRIDDYVKNHIGITPTKIASEEHRNSPPIDLVHTIQRIMAKDHQRTYGRFTDDYNCNFDDEYASELIRCYKREIVRVTAEYGAMPSADIDAYFNVGTNRTYDSIKEEVLLNSEKQNVACTFLHILEKHLTDFE